MPRQAVAPDCRTAAAARARPHPGSPIPAAASGSARRGRRLRSAAAKHDRCMAPPALRPGARGPQSRVVRPRPLELGPGAAASWPVRCACPAAGSSTPRWPRPGRAGSRAPGDGAGDACAPPTAAEVRAAVRTCLALDEDLEPFRARARADRGERRGRARCSGALDRGLGRLLRSPTVFEDAVKTLCTTNCSWALTRAMITRLVEELGEEGPAGRAFPSPGGDGGAAGAVLPGADPGRLPRALPPRRWPATSPRGGSTSRPGATRPSRPPTCAAAIRALDGLRALRDRAPDAAAGRHEGLALDSWTRRKIAELRGRKRQPSDAALGRWFAPWGEWAGLAMWLEATADWHDDAPARP